MTEVVAEGNGALQKANVAVPIPSRKRVNVAPKQVNVASPSQMMWRRFRRHKLALVSIVIVAIFYLVAIFADPVAPMDPNKVNSKWTFMPPQRIRLFHEGTLQWPPFIYGSNFELDPESFQSLYETDTSVMYPVRLFVQGDPYKMWGLIESDIHLIGVEDPNAPFFLLGTDRLGRDVLSRIIFGSRISLSVGLIGVFISMTLGILIGGLSGYYGGMVDLIVQRIIEFLRSMPTIPLWLALSAALPPTWSSLRVYMAIILVLSLISWTWIAQVVRGRFLSLKNEEFVTAARVNGARELRIVLLHMVPSFFSYLIAELTLAIPEIIIGETTLSFLGVGLRPPTISWGVLLKEAQGLQNVALAPWLLFPGAFVVLVVVAFNFMGDGLRDAADPYSRH